MPPRLSYSGARRSLALRSKPLVASQTSIQLRLSSRRGFADKKDLDPATDPNYVLGNVSQEAADLGEVTGQTKPDLEQGTPVEEILQRDSKGLEMAPQAIQDNIMNHKDTVDNLVALDQLEQEAAGHKFALPDLPLPTDRNRKQRYDPMVSQVTNLMMRDGKLSAAQRNMSYILNYLRTAPPPTPNPSRPLLPGSPPASHLPLNPVVYLTLAVDSVAPLLRMRQQKGAAGGGMSLPIPVPLGERQRRRTAVKWILDAASKKPPKGSGRGMFAQRVAEEIVSIVEGKSGAWDKRGLIHKAGTSARANLNYSKPTRR